MKNNRRDFLKLGVAASAAALLPVDLQAQKSANADLNEKIARLAAAPILDKTLFKTPIKIERIELLKNGKFVFVRTVSSDGATGFSVTNGREYLHPLFREIVASFFLGKDARDLETLVDGVYRHASNYKLAGLAFWNSVGWLEVSLMDMLGRIANRSIAELLGGPRRTEIAVYLSSLTRETTPEQEVEQLGKRLQETGARGIKLKVGGRIGRPEPIAGRTEKLIPLARKTFGDKMTIYADANGSYDAKRGIEVGRILEDYGVAIYEEPCPFEEYEDTLAVSQALKKIKVAGGEQDSSSARWRWIVKNRMLDVVQPDIYYNGGLLRTTMVARMAAAAKIGIAPHNPKVGIEEAHLLQFVASVPNLEGLQEYNGRAKLDESFYAPQLKIKNGLLEVPNGAGLGVTIDPDFIKKAAIISI